MKRRRGAQPSGTTESLHEGVAKQCCRRHSLDFIGERVSARTGVDNHCSGDHAICQAGAATGGITA